MSSEPVERDGHAKKAFDIVRTVGKGAAGRAELVRKKADGTEWVLKVVEVSAHAYSLGDNPPAFLRANTNPSNRRRSSTRSISLSALCCVDVSATRCRLRGRRY